MVVGEEMAAFASQTGLPILFGTAEREPGQRKASRSQSRQAQTNKGVP